MIFGVGVSVKRISAGVSFVKIGRGALPTSSPPAAGLCGVVVGSYRYPPLELPHSCS
jgi:hypothetical protein